MRTPYILLAMTVALLEAGIQQVAAQCTNSSALNVSLGAGQTESTSIFLSGDLTSFTVNLNFTGAGGSWPADMLISVFGPDGNCVGWGGYSYGVTNGCNDLGSGLGGIWPDGWNTSASGFYTFTQDASTWGLNGSGDWTVEIENAYNSSPGVTYDIEFVFDGPCEGDCPDPEACNYVSVEEQTNPLEDACLYAEDLYGVGYGCDGECLGDSDGDGICDATDTCDGVIDECGECAGTGMLGCTDVTACNYDENATCDDGGCLELDDCGECGGSGVLGCTDFTACNFDPSATCDSGGCLTLDECGECGGSGYLACTDSTACNYDPGASCDDGSCLFNDALGVCGGPCAEDADADGICDVCTEPDGYWLEVETVMEHMGGELDGMTTYQVHVVCESADDFVYSISGGAASPLIINTTSGIWYNNASNDDWNASGLTEELLSADPLAAYDSYLTIGSDDSEGPEPTGLWFVGNDPRPEFEPGGGNNVLIEGGSGLVYQFYPGMGQVNTHPAFAGEDLRVLVMQITTAGDLDGLVSVRIYPNGESQNAVSVNLEFDSSSACYNLDDCVGGELDECGVCAGPGAIYECGCSGPAEGFCDCDGNMLDALGVCGGPCMADIDGDGVCDTEEVLGCDDAMACNYSDTATENDGSCVFAEEYFDCDGDCLADADMDGVCDELEIVGCTDDMACNYDPAATDSDDSCTYPEPNLDCNGDCMNDVNNNDICDELELAGCTDDTACNFNADAVLDDGSCDYAATYYNCDGDCENDADGDGVCDELEVEGCMQLEACNFDPDATDGDDSCELPGDDCDDENDATVNDTLTDDCECVGEVDKVDEFKTWGIELFPTPVQDVMRIQFRGEATGQSRLVMKNAAGQIVRTEHLQGDGIVDVSGMAEGMYFITLDGVWGTATRRVVVAGGR